LTFSFLLFGLFYGQYVWIPRVLKRQLNITLGFVQAFLSLALLLFGLSPIWLRGMGASVAFNPDNIAVTIAILGEALFVVNVCWTLLVPASSVVPQAAPVANTAEALPLQVQLQPSSPLQAQKKARFDFSRWRKPENPVERFGVTAILLLVGGIMIWLVMPESRFLILIGGHRHLLPMSLLWWIGALPFAIFSLAYWFHAGRRSAPYDKWATGIHLALTFVWLIDFVRIVTIAQWFILSRLPDLMLDGYTFELYVLLGGAIAMFFVNLRATARAAR